MLTLSSGIKDKLMKLNQRKLTKGEIFLFAKAISDFLPLPPRDEENVLIYLTTKQRGIDEVIYKFNDYSYLDSDATSEVKKLIASLLIWRCHVAYNPGLIIFREDANVVIDDLSYLPKFVDVGYMCAVGDSVQTATYTYNLFREFIKEVMEYIPIEG